MNIPNLAPIILFTYNRASHTKQTIEALQKNELAQESDLFIYSDGGKDFNSWEKVNEVRKYLKTINGFKKITIIEQKENLGLANSIISGVTKIINEYGKIIVLEDDIITSLYFLTFMNNALNYYNNKKKVMHISGFMHPINPEAKIDETFFIKPTSCWGWATWKDRWVYFNNDVDYICKSFTNKLIQDFNLDNTYNFWDQIVKNRNKEIKTWAIFWYATVYLNNGLSLHPRHSYCKNIGFDNSGTHCGESNNTQHSTLNTSSSIFTNKFEISQDAQIELKKYFKRQKHHHNNIQCNKYLNTLLSQIDELKNTNNNYLIYGAGTLGTILSYYIKEQIVAFLDNNQSKQKLLLNGKNIYHPKDINTLKYNKIIISVLGREDEIRNLLINQYNVSSDDIIEIYI